MAELFVGVLFQFSGYVHILGALQHLRINYVGNNGLIFSGQIFIQGSDEFFSRQSFPGRRWGGFFHFTLLLWKCGASSSNTIRMDCTEYSTGPVLGRQIFSKEQRSIGRGLGTRESASSPRPPYPPKQ